MSQFDLNKMQEIQKELQEKYRDKWGGLSPEKARSQFLWMIAEAGEAAQIIKKSGDDAIVNDPAVRQHFIEEMCDILMYFNDVLLSYDIAPEELENIYRQKHEKNMHRW